MALCGFAHSAGKRCKAMEVTVKDGQTLADIAVQEHGTWEAALDMAMENGVSLTDTLEAGRTLRLPEGEKLLQGTRGEPGDGKGREQRKATDFR